MHTRKPGHGYTRETLKETESLLIAAKTIPKGPIIYTQKMIIRNRIAQKEYKTKHYWVGIVIHWELCKGLKFDYDNVMGTYPTIPQRRTCPI